MTVQEWEKDFYGNNVTITTRDNECVIYRIRDDSGDSVLTRFEVYPGIALIYNDVHTDYISIKELVGYENILEINHCREGRIEFESSEGECLYVKKGDMAINMKAGVKSYSYFPQSHYHGVTIEIDFDKIEKNQNMIMKEMQLSPKILQDKFCNHKQCIVLHEKQEFEHLFSEIYCVPEQIKKSYYKIKVMEILLFLFALDTTKEKIENRYFNNNLVAKVKEIHQYMLKQIVIPLSVMFRFFPTVGEEASSISDAMRMRGISFGGNHPGKMLEYRLIPLMTCSVKIGDELSAAALTRGLGADVKRTNICKIGFRFVDYIVLLGCIITLAYLLLVKIGGFL